ncbi:MAG: PKD domain-containing protein [Bacteroidota bacterium]
MLKRIGSPLLTPLFLIGMLTATFVRAQPTISCPAVIASPDTTLACSGCVNLNATPVAGSLPTSYTVQTIPYNPWPNTGTAIIVNQDDIWSGVLPIPFNFCFYGNTYNQCVVGSNGIVSFDVGQAGGYCPWPINNPIPNPANPTNCIMGPWHDTDPSVGGIIRWSVFGTAPCRVFVVSFNTIPMFSCNNLISTQQIVIYETTNIIETYIQAKPTCTTWNSGAAIHGLHNINGTAATVVPGRNFPTQWTVNNDARRFVPSGPQNFTVNWFQVGNATPIATTQTTQVCPTVNTDYYAEVVYTNCDNSTVTVRDTVMIGVAGPQISLNPTINNPSCPGATDGTITVSPAGGLAPYTYAWSPNGGNGATTTPLGAGTYTVSVTDANNCVAIDSFTLTDPPAIQISTTSTDASCNGGSDGAASATASGGTPGYNYFWVPGNIAGPNATNLSAGTYTVFVSDQNNCLDSATVTINQPPALTTSVSATAVSCAGGGNGTATATAGGGTPPYGYLWNTNPAQTTATATGLSGGTYIVTVTDANLCPALDTITVAEPLPIIAQVNNLQNVSCNGSADGWAVVSVTGQQGPVTYTWNTNPVQTTDSASGLPPGTWTVTATDSLGCTATASVTISEPAPIGLTMNGQNISCFNAADGCANVVVTGGNGNYSYDWSNGGTVDSICNLAPGTYVVTVTDTFSTGTNNRILYFEDFDGLVNWTLNVASGSNGADHNFWVVNDNEGGLPPPACGTANNGDSTLHITSVAFPNGGAAYDAGGLCGTLFCPETNMRAESPVISTVGYSSITLEFNFIANGDSIFDNASVVMNDGSGWTTVVPSLKSNVCLNLQGEWQNFSVVLPPSADNNPNLRVGFNWTNNDDGIGTDPSVSINNVQLRTAAANTPAIFCTAVDSVTITQPDSLAATFTVIDVPCNGDSTGCIGVNLTGGNGNYSYLWSNGATSDSICGLAAGVYTLTVTDTSAVTSGSSSVTVYTEDFDGTATWNLNVPTGTLGANPNFWVINDNEGGVLPPGCGVANNGDSTLHITSFIFPTAGAAYDAGGLCGILTCPETNYRAESPTISTIGISNLTLSFDYISVGQGLIDNASVVYNDGTGWQVLNPSIKSLTCVNLQGQWTAISLALPPSCNNIPNLQVGFNWTNNDDGAGSDPSIAVNNLEIDGITAGSSTPVTCVLIDSAVVGEPPALALSINGYDASCFGTSDGAAAVSASGGTPGYSVVWNTTQTGDSISGLPAGTYTALVADTLGCLDSISVTINQPTPITLTMSSIPVTCNGDTSGCAIVTASGGSGGYTYLWSTAATNDTSCSLGAGIYTVTVTDTASAACFAIDSVVVTEPSAVSLSATATGAACSTATGTATVSASGGTAPYTYNWNTTPVQTTPTAVNLLPGVYLVTVTDTLGCTDTLNVTVPDIPAPTITLVSTMDVSCFGGNDGSATVSTAGGTPPVTVTWNSPLPQTGLTATGLPAGTYTATVTDTFGCTNAVTVTIGEPTPLTLTLSGNTATCNLSNGDATVVASGGTSPYQVLWSNAQSSNTIGGLAAGVYSVTVTDNNQCQVIDSIAIGQTGNPVQNVTAISPVSCSGGNDGAATVQVSLGVPPYTITWNTNPPQIGVNAIGLSAGTYLVTALDQNGCSATDTVIVTEPTPVSGTASATDVTCFATIPNGTAGILASGGTSPYTYAWGTTPVQTTAQATGLSPGTYSVTVTDANGCTYVDDATVGQQPVPSVVAGPDASFCEGDGGALIFATASGGVPGYYYQWWCDSTNTFCGLDSINDNDPIANPTVSTTYYVQVFDTNGCPSNIDSLFVTILPKPIVDAGPDIFLCGDSAPCQVLNPVIVNNAQLSGIYGYNWSPGAGLNDSTIATPCARPDTTTIYSLVVTDSTSGCASELTTTDTLATITVHVNPIPIAEAGPDLDICDGDSVLLQGFGTGAGPDYTYQWTPGTLVVDSTVANPIAFPPFTTIFSLVVNSNGCPSYADSVEVRVHTDPTVEAGWDREICLGETTLLDAQAGGDSTATYSFLWSPTDGFISDSTAEDPIVGPDTTTTYYVIAITNFGCESAPDSATVYLKPTPIAEAGPDFFICDDACDTLAGSYFYTTTDSAPNASQVYFAWSPAADLSATTILDPVVCPPNSGWYYLEVRHRDCITQDSVLITVGPEISAVAGGDTSVICANGSVQLNADSSLGTEFTWLPPLGLDDPNSPNPVASPDTTTTYTLIVSEGGCFDTTAYTIEILPEPVAEYASSAPEGCVPHDVHFTNLSRDGIFYIWDFGDGSPVSNETHPVHTYAGPGAFTVTLTAVSGGACDGVIDSIRIVVEDTARAAFGTNPDFPAQLSFPATSVGFTDRSQNATSWYWDFGDGITSTETNPTHQYTAPGEYFVTLAVNSALGCVSRVTNGPFVIALPELFIPNVFSPNDDDINDRFLVEYTGDQPFQLTVYDRWGVMLYDGRNKVQGWNGKDLNGNDVATGVYYYYVRVGDREYTGDLTLVR